jgi:hypothetical protein
VYNLFKTRSGAVASQGLRPRGRPPRFAPTSVVAHVRDLLDQSPKRLSDATLEQGRDRMSGATGGKSAHRVIPRDGSVHQRWHCDNKPSCRHCNVRADPEGGRGRRPTPSLRPRFAAPNIEVPIQVKVFVAADTGNGLFLTAHVTSDLVERRRRVEHGKTLSQPPNSGQRLQ